MITEISIAFIIIILIVMWAVKGIIITKPGHVTMIGILGAKPEEIRGPGLSFVLWPLELVVEMIPTGRQTVNYENSKLTCTIDKVSKRSLDLTHNGVAELNAPMISVAYQIDFGDPQNPTLTDKLNGYYELCSNGHWDKTKVEEMIKDIMQGKLRDYISKNGLGLLEVMTQQHKIIKSIQRTMEKEFSEDKMPIKILEMTLNDPIVPTQKDISDAVQSKATAIVQKAAAIERKDIEEYEAGRNKEIKKKEGEAEGAKEAAKITAIAEARKKMMQELSSSMSVNDLPPERRAEFWLALEANEAFKEMAKNPNKTFIIGSNLMEEAKAIFARLAGGKQ